MQLECTKKLLDTFKAEPVAAELDINPFFAWTANLLMYKRRKVLVAVNNATGASFIYYGLTAKDVKDLNLIIAQGIYSLFGTFGIEQKYIKKYLEACGDLAVTKTSSRKYIARCNSIVEFLEANLDHVLGHAQAGLTIYGKANEYPLKTENGYSTAIDMIPLAFKQTFGTDQIFDTEYAIVDIVLQLDKKHKCKRRIGLPINYSLYGLHCAIQSVFNWNNTHLHKFEFTYPQLNDYLYPNIGTEQIPEHEYDEAAEQRENSISLKEIFGIERKFGYLYDFGDEWEHSIALVRIERRKDYAKPDVLSAVGDAPAEDAGGASGWIDKLQIMNNPKHEDYNDFQYWLNIQNWKKLDIDTLRRQLRSALS